MYIYVYMYMYMYTCICPCVCIHGEDSEIPSVFLEFPKIACKFPFLPAYFSIIWSILASICPIDWLFLNYTWYLRNYANPSSSYIWVIIWSFRFLHLGYMCYWSNYMGNSHFVWIIWSESSLFFIDICCSNNWMVVSFPFSLFHGFIRGTLEVIKI